MESGVFSWQMEGIDQATVKKRSYVVFSNAGLGIGEFDQRIGAWLAWHIHPAQSIASILPLLTAYQST
jgi:hypothetical protein